MEIWGKPIDPCQQKIQRTPNPLIPVIASTLCGKNAVQFLLYVHVSYALFLGQPVNRVAQEDRNTYDQ